jgi:hypothetical protein
MRRLLIMVAYVFSGVIGAWIGYWVGHALGWSTNAEWPWSIGTGTGAILLAFGMSVLFIVAAAVLLTFSSGRRVRQALDFGLPARASVLSIEKTGDQSTTPDGKYDQVRCELEVRPRDGEPYRTRITQFLTEGYLQGLRPGDQVQVRYDPVRRTRVAIIEPAAPRRR